VAAAGPRDSSGPCLTPSESAWARLGVWAIIAAAGSGSRFGAPKQFTDLGGITVLDRAIASAAGCAEGVVLVLPPDCRSPSESMSSGAGGSLGSTGQSDEAVRGGRPLPSGVAGSDLVAGLARAGCDARAVQAGDAVPGGIEVRAVQGGATRSGSVRCGLAVVPDDAAVVVVHDAARPLASAVLFEAVIEAVRRGADAAVPVIPVTDTVRQRSGGTLDRDELMAVQTPQAFAAEALRQAHAAGGEASDDAALVERAGGTVVLIDGDSRNIKITNPADLVVARALLEADSGPEASTTGSGPQRCRA